MPIESLIPRSIYKTDFTGWEKIMPRQGIIVPVIKPGPKPRSKYRPVQMDLEILQPFKPGADVPFSLLHRRKRIIQINPHAPIPNVKLEDKMFELKLKARRERQQVYLVPQISLDNIPEDIMYGESGKSGLVSSLYSSDWKKASKFAIEHTNLKMKEKEEVKFLKKDIVDKSIERTRATGCEVVAPMDPALKKYLPAWDQDFPVEYVDTTKLFWEKNQDRGLCSICDPQPAAKGLTDDEKAELDACLKEDALRTPYTLHPPGYTGYIPRLAVGIQFRKKKFTKYDTFLSSLMEAQGVFENKI